MNLIELSNQISIKDKETQEEYQIDKYIVIDGYDVLIYIAENEYDPIVLTQYFTGESMKDMLERHGMELV